ncbi:hypothetical protein UB37_07855 [Photobacterium iliopiscarium]|uniref:Uncharacterized protein n=1 Tax=Photobacterium iliopiscarium TaxID=56192 RepID=A0ABX5GRQ0_9GAMM|nr:hypothetical protein UB37_07855 [Photobacterium iliopiscarium]PSW96370.1 hypothetical protein C9J52_10690 [Photobacterium iliopiscarium]
MNKEILHLFQYILMLHQISAAPHHNSANKDRKKCFKCYKHAFQGLLKVGMVFALILLDLLITV